MKLRALKTGKFANADPGKPHLNLIITQRFEADDATARNLIEAGWAEVPPPDEIIQPNGKPHIFLKGPTEVLTVTEPEPEPKKKEQKRRPGGRRKTREKA